MKGQDGKGRGEKRERERRRGRQANRQTTKWTDLISAYVLQLYYRSVACVD